MKKLRYLFLLIFISAIVLAAVSCDNDSGSPKVYTVTLDYGESLDKVTKEVADGGKFIFPEALKKDGFEFDYFTDADGGKHKTGEEIVVKADMTFTAVWAALYRVTVNYDNGTDAVVKSLRNGETYTLPLEEPEKTGYVFLGYKDEDGKEYEKGSSVKVEKALIFTAFWRETTSASYTVTVDYGTSKYTETVTDGTKFTLPQPEERADYEFISYKSGESTYKAGDKLTVTSDMTFTAQWARLYTVTVNSNNGSEKSSIKAREGEYTLPQAPENGSAVFKAWKLGDKEYNAGDKITLSGDIEIKALWMTYTVVFKNGDTVVDTKTVESGKAVDKTEKTVQKEGYTFTGWGLNSALYDFTSPVTKDIILEALWQEKGKVTVTLRVNGTEKITTIESGTSYTLPDTAAAKTGFTFKNWKCGEKEYEKGATVSSVTTNMVFEAQYEADDITVTFKYDDKDGKEQSVTNNIKAGEKVTIVPKITAPEGKTFEGWKAEGSGRIVDVTGPFYETMTLEPYYEYIRLTVTFKFNDDGKTKDSTRTVSYGGHATKPYTDMTRSGYTFLGWFKNLEDEKESAFNFEETPITEDTILYAKWEVVKDEESVTLKLISNGDEEKGIEAFSYEYKFKKGSSVSLSSYVVTTDNAYEIEKWSYGTEGEAYYYPYASITLDKDLTLTAVWKEKMYSINFMFNGATFKENSGTEHSGSYQANVKWGTTISDVFSGGTLSNSDENYTLDCWTDYGGTTHYEVDYKITKSLGYLCAVWKTEKTCTVTFDYGYDSKKETATVTYGTSASEPSRPVMEGYSFGGWYNGEETSQFDFDSEIIEDTTLTAKWTKVEKYKVTYMNVDGMTEYASQEVLCGKTAQGVVLPQLSGMEAVGWYRIGESTLELYGSPYDFSTPLQEDIVLMPKYTPTEDSLLGTWSLDMGRSSIDFDFKQEGGENVLYITDVANSSSKLVKAGTWNYDSDEGALTLDVDDVNTVVLNWMCYGYSFSALGTTKECLTGLNEYSGSEFELERSTPSDTVTGSWEGETGNWSVDITFSDDNTFEDKKTLYKDSAGKGDVVAKMETNGSYVFEKNYNQRGDDFVYFVDMENEKVLGTPKTVFQSSLVFATGSDGIGIAGFLGFDVLPLVRK